MRVWTFAHRTCLASKEIACVHFSVTQSHYQIKQKFLLPSNLWTCPGICSHCTMREGTLWTLAPPKLTDAHRHDNDAERQHQCATRIHLPFWPGHSSFSSRRSFRLCPKTWLIYFWIQYVKSVKGCACISLGVCVSVAIKSECQKKKSPENGLNWAVRLHLCLECKKCSTSFQIYWVKLI